jgi:hypothetical protein
VLKEKKKWARGEWHGLEVEGVLRESGVRVGQWVSRGKWAGGRGIEVEGV